MWKQLTALDSSLRPMPDLMKLGVPVPSSVHWHHGLLGTDWRLGILGPG
jgi:hypothetical protein